MTPKTIERATVSQSTPEQKIKSVNTVDQIKSSREKISREQVMQNIISKQARKELSLEEHGEFLEKIKKNSNFKPSEKESLIKALSENQMATEGKRAITELVKEIHSSPEKISDMYDLVNLFPTSLENLTLPTLVKLKDYGEKLNDNSNSLVNKFYDEAKNKDHLTFLEKQGFEGSAPPQETLSTKPLISESLNNSKKIETFNSTLPVSKPNEKIDNTMQAKWERHQKAIAEEKSKTAKEKEAQEAQEYKNIIEGPVNLENTSFILKAFDNRLNTLKDRLFQIYSRKNLDNKSYFFEKAFDKFEKSPEFLAIQKLKQKIIDKIDENYSNEDSQSNQALNNQRELIKNSFDSYESKARFKTKVNFEYNSNKALIERQLGSGERIAFEKNETEQESPSDVEDSRFKVDYDSFNDIESSPPLKVQAPLQKNLKILKLYRL